MKCDLLKKNDKLWNVCGLFDDVVLIFVSGVVVLLF